MSKTLSKDLAELALQFRASASVTDDAIGNFLQSLDCPRSLSIWICYQHDHKEIPDFSCLPSDYLDGQAFRDAYTATSFLSKFKRLKLDTNKQELAFAKFMLFEEQCRRTNRRFQNLSLDTLYTGIHSSLLHAMSRKIEKVLGEFDAEEFADCANWGPGVTTMLSGPEVSAYNKFRSEIGITRDLYHLVGESFYLAYPGWTKFIHETHGGFLFQKGNTVITVPKNAKIDRVIAVEPGINLWFQKSAGTMIRRRLQRFGIDLNSQVRNQELAKRSSLDDSLATVDFSSASDSIASSIVREVIPHKWYMVLDCLRSKLGVSKKSGDIQKWEKFSSMGNGFTFELESLIFFAAASAVCDHLKISQSDISVFGDDVIIPKAGFELFVSFCEFLGFTVNTKKSFSSGAFRESCGAHYYNGIDCKPLYLKEECRYVESVYKLANGIRDLAHRRNNYYGCDARFRYCWSNLFSRVPKPLRLRIPSGKGDGGFSSNFDEAVPSCKYRIRARGGIEGYHTLALQHSGVTRSCDDYALILRNISQVSIQAYKNTYTLRGRTRLSFKKILVAQWYNYGLWY